MLYSCYKVVVRGVFIYRSYVVDRDVWDVCEMELSGRLISSVTAELAYLRAGHVVLDFGVESVPVVFGNDHGCGSFCAHVAMFAAVEVSYCIVQ